MDSEEILLDAEDRMEKAEVFFRQELVGIRTGRASPGLVESVRVEYYGSQTPLKQIANISAPEAQLLVVRPFDSSSIKDVEKAILSSNLGLTPNSDGKIIRLAVPSLSGDQRKKFVSRVKELTEESRVTIRNIRREANKRVESATKEKILTEDERDHTKEEIQDLTKQYEKKVNDLAEKKEKEIMD